MENGPIEDAEIREPPLDIPQKSFLGQGINSMLEKSAGTMLGQYLMELLDHFMKGIEDTTKWSLPQESEHQDLVRPLPWILFLGLIMILRVVRLVGNIFAYIIGSDGVTAKTMVSFIQRQRRSLRSLRLRGLKVIRQQEFEELRNQQSNNMQNANIILKFLTYLTSRPSKIIEKQMQHRMSVSHNPYKVIDTETKKPEISSLPSDTEEKANYNLSLSELLEKYAVEDSDNDPDFVPNLEDLERDSSSESMGSSENEDEDTSDLTKSEEERTSDTELLIKDANKKIGEDTKAKVLLAHSTPAMNSLSKLKMINISKNISLIPPSIIESINEEQAKEACNGDALPHHKIETVSINGNNEDKQKFAKESSKKATKTANGPNTNGPTNVSNGF